MSIRFVAFSVLALLLAATVSVEALAADSCRYVFFTQKKIDRFRAEITTAAMAAAQTRTVGDIPAPVLAGTEVAVLGSARHAANALALGSSLDVLRLLRDFPLARHLHLADAFSEAGPSPLRLLEETEARLKSLHPSAKIEVVSAGFRDQLQDKELRDFAKFRLRRQQDTELAKQPLVWRLTWPSAEFGTIERMISFHLVDLTQTATIQEFLQREFAVTTTVADETTAAQASLAGVLISGLVLPPKVPVFKTLNSFVLSGASIVWEHLYDSNASFENGVQATVLSEVEKSAGWSVQRAPGLPGVSEEGALSAVTYVLTVSTAPMLK